MGLMLNRVFDLLKGAFPMVYARSSASGSAAAVGKRGGFAEAQSPAPLMPPTKRPLAAFAASGDAATALSTIAVYRATPLERIDMIRRGVLASEAKRMLAELSMGQAAVFKALNLPTATVNRKAKDGETLSPEESERIVGFAKLVGQLEAMIQDSGYQDLGYQDPGDPARFDARAWMARWLTEPLPAFGGTRPADLMDTMEGQGLVSAALARIESGAYA